MLQTQTVEAGTLSLIKTLLADPALKHFYLVGGTALSLQLGHRMSVDIDLFTHRPFESKAISDYLATRYQTHGIRPLQNAVFCHIDNVKVDIIAHQYPLQRELIMIEGIRMVSLEDIGAMKLHAIHQNGSRLKDFVDMSVLLERLPLRNMLSHYANKYPGGNASHAQQALLYHADINYNDTVKMVNRVFDRLEMETRLRMAVKHPENTFSASQVRVKNGRRQIESKD